MFYYVDGLGGPIINVAANLPFGAIWNPSSTRRIKVLQLSLLMRDWDSPPNSMYAARISTRGTAGSTVTPDADNAEDGASAPPSGFLLDLAEYTVQPTILTPELYGPMTFPPGNTGSEGSGFAIPTPRGIVILPGQGLGIFVRLSSSFGGTWDINFVVED